MKKRTAKVFFLICALCVAFTACSDNSGSVDVHTPDIASSALTTENTPSASSSGSETSESFSDTVTTADVITDVTDETSTQTDTQGSGEITTETTTENTTKNTTENTTDTSVVTTTEPITEKTTEITTQPPQLQPSPPTILSPEASGTRTESNSLGTIDYSNTSDGYIMAKYTGKASKVKVQIKGPDGVTQTYNLRTDGKYESFPLSAGNGDYSVLVAENVSGTSYAVAAQLNVSVSLSSSLDPFLRPNQYIDYDLSSTAVKKASELCGGTKTALEKVDRVYSWIVDNVKYDTALADSVKSGYLPDHERVMSKKKGICLDYAGTATVMLRSQNVPTQLVVGYAGDVYHAWINVYVKDTGWIYGAIYFDGSGWQRLDPTFAATGNSSSEVLQYIGNGKNYSQKYLY